MQYAFQGITIAGAKKESRQMSHAELPHPLPHIPKHPHPRRSIRALFEQPLGEPGHLERAGGAFGVGHHDGETPVRGGEAGEAPGRAVGVGGVEPCCLAPVVDVAHRGQRSILLGAVPENGPSFAVAYDDGHAAACHPGKEDGRGHQHFHHRKTRFELFATVTVKARPVFSAGDDGGKVSHHLTSVADP